jgi:uncharacterized membrane protein YjjB (DUF3815 family)
MVPGAYAFRAAIGSLQIAHGAVAPPLVATLALGVTVVLMVTAIAIGIAVPVLLFAPDRHLALGGLVASPSGGKRAL